MANPTEAFSGTETVSTTEWSMTTDTAGPDVETSDGYFTFVIDLSALGAGDVFTMKLYEKVVSGATQRLADSWTFSGVQSRLIVITPSFPLMHGWEGTLIKEAGIDRSITWSIRKAT